MGKKAKRTDETLEKLGLLLRRVEQKRIDDRPLKPFWMAHFDFDVCSTLSNQNYNGWFDRNEI